MSTLLLLLVLAVLAVVAVVALVALVLWLVRRTSTPAVAPTGPDDGPGRPHQG